LIKRFADIVAEEDPGRRFVATSSTGPRFYADEADFGKGLHWDVHGPWKADPDLGKWESYWKKVDALFHSEVGCPGSSPADIIEHYRGDYPAMPASTTNPLWRRTSWWIDWDLFLEQGGKEDASLDDYIRWSQERQAQALTIVASNLKGKFPRCGGVIFWMGHDCFPCTANTSAIDFWGRYKPAALALKKIFLSKPEEVAGLA
jgi:beta-mannosidase